VSIKVIGAGLPRTGTLTQKLALEQLGFGPSYHWVNLITGPDQVEIWNEAMDGKPAWTRAFEGYASTTDWPGGYFYRELMDFYPESKVLLSDRDPESWEKSFSETIVAFCHGESLVRLLSSARRQVDPHWDRYLDLVDRMFWGPQGTFAAGHDRDQLIKGMIEHNEAVKRIVPPERLLVWRVTEGWERLCEFLEVDVPDGPLPHENDREVFLGRVTDGAINALNAWRERQTQTAEALG
jgi:hypothetical protein